MNNNSATPNIPIIKHNSLFNPIEKMQKTVRSTNKIIDEAFHKIVKLINYKSSLWKATYKMEKTIKKEIKDKKEKELENRLYGNGNGYEVELSALQNKELF